MVRIILITISLVFLSMCYASTEQGKCEYGKEEVEEVTCFGPGKMFETRVRGNVSIAGPINAGSTIMMASMNVLGEANLTHSNVKSNVTVAGHLNAIHGKFDGDLLIISDKSSLNASMVNGSITMKSEKTPSELKVICGTKISGDIVFEGQSGIVKKTADSSIAGKVTNGQVEEIVDETCKKKSS